MEKPERPKAHNQNEFEELNREYNRLMYHYKKHLASLPVAFPAPWLKDIDDAQIKELGIHFEIVYQRFKGHFTNDDWYDISEAEYKETTSDYKRIIAVPINQDKQQDWKPKIYIASKTKHANKWVKLRESGVNVISTWIDEAEFGQTKDMADLCRRCIDECLTCDALIVYREDEDYLKGAFIEMGIVLSKYKGLTPIYLVGPVLPQGSAFTYSHQVFGAKTIEEAIIKITQS